MYEKNILFFGDIESDPSTPTDAIEVDYSEIGVQVYVNTYNALKDYYSDYPQSNNIEVDYVDSLPVEFTTETDAKLYTGATVASPTSNGQQQTAYLLDVRNILLIFLLGYFVMHFYSRLKHLIINYFEG